VELKALIDTISSLPEEDIIDIKQRIVTKLDKHLYTKETLSLLTKEEAIKTIEWLRRKYE
jgi:hypothetical protein